MPPYIRQDPPSSRWLSPAEMDDDYFSYDTGRILLGRVKNAIGTKKTNYVGIDDNRHIVTIAGSRAGKSATSLIPNLLLWQGSTIVIDPKGELALHTAKHRQERLGQDVHILDPFHAVTDKKAGHQIEHLRSRFNPMAEIMRYGIEDHIDDAALMADALVIPKGDDDHWTLSAKSLIQGVLLWQMTTQSMYTLGNLRNILNSARTAPEGENEFDRTTDQIQLYNVLELMKQSEAYDGIVANAGHSFTGKPDDEAGSVLSTATEELSFLRSSKLADHLNGSDFFMSSLKEKPTTVYLVLPASRLATHFRWLRVVLTLAMSAMERTESRTNQPILFMLEEFPVLGHMQLLETAAGLMAGYGVKLWTVMQDLSQLQRHYPKSWETFLGNAGIIEAFGTADATTTEYLSKRLGRTLTKQIQPNDISLSARAGGAQEDKEQIQYVDLLAPYEITRTFARTTNKKLILIPEYPPFSVNRVFWKDLFQ